MSKSNAACDAAMQYVMLKRPKFHTIYLSVLSGRNPKELGSTPGRSLRPL